MFVNALVMVSVQVSLENSNFKQAVEDLMTCLAKRLKALPADSRYLYFAWLFLNMTFIQVNCRDALPAWCCSSSLRGLRQCRKEFEGCHCCSGRQGGEPEQDGGVREHQEGVGGAGSAVSRHQGADERPQGYAEGSLQAGQGLRLCVQK